MKAAEIDTLWDLRNQMVRIRRFEEKAGQMYGLRKIGGFCHLYNGQEAIAVGVSSVMDMSRDYVLTGYRDHGHALAAGMNPDALMAELFGKVTGSSRGKGGSMHFFDADKHFLGGNGIVGAQIPVAVGVAFAQKYRKTGGATVVFFGDGASGTSLPSWCARTISGAWVPAGNAYLPWMTFPSWLQRTVSGENRWTAWM